MAALNHVMNETKILVKVSETYEPYRHQDYQEIKAKLLHTNKLFEDPLFPACNESIYKKQAVPKNLTWKRPHEICKQPQFIVDSIDRNDIDQGYIGDCWFIAAASGVAANRKLISRVIPEDQSFQKSYAGIFHFRFWLYGRWVDVVIDDRLPCQSNGQLLFSSNCSQPDEFWVSLLEKAYAKFYGCYEKLIGGHIYNAYIDMTGGIQEGIFDLINYNEKKLWTVLTKAKSKGSLMGCSINAKSNEKEGNLKNGLITTHAYTITDIIELNNTKGVHKLLRIRNPWGNSKEWNGAWSDESGEWNNCTDQQKKLYNSNKKDGEFWMCFSDFIKNWDKIGLCHLTPDSMSAELLETDDDSDLEWVCRQEVSSWVKGKSAGGCESRWWENPQFKIDLEDVDDDDGEKKCSVILGLMQKARANKPDMFWIGFTLYKINKNVHVPSGSRPHFSSSQLTKVTSSGSYQQIREVSARFRLDQGSYVIIPSTWYADEESDFLLRIFTEVKKKGTKKH